MPTKKANGEGSIHKRDNGTWRGQITIGYKEDGTVKRKSFTGKTKKEVIEKIEEYRTLNNKGLLPTDDIITLSQWFHTWLFTYRIHDLKPSSFERYEGLYKNYILNSSIGSIKLKDLKTSHIQTYYNSLVLEKDKSPSTIKTINKCLKSSLSQALKEGYILKNHCLYITLPKEHDNLNNSDIIRVFTIEEQKLFMNAALKSNNGLIYIFALGTGLRLGELLALRWSDINLKEKTISITKTIKETYTFDKNEKRHYAIIEQPPKTASSIRKIPLNDNLIDLLQNHRKEQLLSRNENIDIYFDDYLVFCAPSGVYLNSSNVRKSFKRILKKCNLSSDFRIHDLRHTFATRLFEKGVAPKTVQSFLGHSNVQTTLNIYTHVMKDTKSEAINTLNDIFNFN